MGDVPKLPPFRITEQATEGYSGVLIEFSKEAFAKASRDWTVKQRFEHNQRLTSPNPVERVRSLLSVLEAIQAAE
ncbi:MAG TPA: hypothetical protein VNT99_01770 [Methylomirabilota bacterium]|nr:hypothetical protein [Methylomirabilota bacterium]